MSDSTFLLLHSPLLGPSSWGPVRDELIARGRRSMIADLVPAVTGPPPHLPRIAVAARTAIGRLGRSVAVVAHSGAGPLVPAAIAAARGAVTAVVFVDATLPYPGLSWFESAPAELADRLRALAGADDTLPPWHEWFGRDAIGALVSDPAAARQLCADIPRVPLSYLAEPTSEEDGWRTVPTAYLRLSDAYLDAERVAIDAGWPTDVLAGANHLSGYTEPRRVVDAVDRLLARLDTTGD